MPRFPRPLPPVPDDDWRDDAACRGRGQDLDDVLFGSDRTGPSRLQPLPEPWEVCGQCPVRRPCLQVAFENDEAFGVWGGMTPGQRRLLRQQFPDAAPADLACTVA